MNRYLSIGAVLLIVACGKPNSKQALSDGGFDEADVVVHSRAVFQVTAGDSDRSVARFASTSQETPVTVTNAASTTMTLDNSEFVPPAISNAVMDFGKIKISSLSDNDLKVCGAGGDQKCNTAMLRIYTSGVAGAGLWNAADGYGAPLTASLTSAITMGLGAVNAAIMQTLSIPTSKRVVRLSDFTASPAYTIKADFTDAGTGSFSTNIVVEYALAP